MAKPPATVDYYNSIAGKLTSCFFGGPKKTKLNILILGRNPVGLNIHESLSHKRI